MREPRRGAAFRLKTRSLVGLLPLCATVVLEGAVVERFPRLVARIEAFLRRNPSMVRAIGLPGSPGVQDRRLLAIMNEDKLRRVLARMLDPQEFLSDYGIRSLSRWHLDHPYVLRAGGQDHVVRYEPAESSTGAFGGNSNWRGPVWFPINALLIRALRQNYLFYGGAFTVEFPTGSGVQMTLYEISEQIVGRLLRIFRRDANGRRPVFGGAEKFQTDPHWRDSLLFYEYFHGENGAGLGASHQTGWTGLAALAIALGAGGGRTTFLSRGTEQAVAAAVGRDR